MLLEIIRVVTQKVNIIKRDLIRSEVIFME